MKIDKIVYVPGKGHIVCVRSFDEHVFKVGDKVTLTSSEEIGLKKTMFVTQISSIERMGMNVLLVLNVPSSSYRQVSRESFTRISTSRSQVWKYSANQVL